MNQLMDMPLHAGPEMDRAINRTDFFRLFKSVCRTSGFDNFMLIQQVDRGTRLDAVASYLLTSLSDQERPAIARALSEDRGAVLSRRSPPQRPLPLDFR
jgi:LuxR family transcriptional regulator